MTNTINMKDMMYLNLFTKITRVRTPFCFKYNEAIVFCVPKRLVSKSIGKEGENVKRLSSIFRKRIKIIPTPSGIENAREFIQAIVSPLTFRNLEVKDDDIIITAGNQSKAALIGREKRRFLEMQRIVKDYFNKDFKII